MKIKIKDNEKSEKIDSLLVKEDIPFEPASQKLKMKEETFYSFQSYRSQTDLAY